MVGFLFDSELGQHGRLSILNLDSLGSMYRLSIRLSILDLGSMVGFLFWTWAAWSAFYSILNLGSMVGFLFWNLGSMVGFLFYSDLGSVVYFLFTTWAALSAFYLQVGQHGRLSILNLDSMVCFLLTSWTAWSALYSDLDSMVGFVF